MNIINLFQLFIFVLILHSSLFAQRISEPLKKKQFELGYSHYWYKGDFYWKPANPSTNDVWNNGTIYFRIGLYNVITLSVEAMVWPVNSSKNYPGEAFLNYTFGMTLTSPTVKIIFLDSYVNLHYLENTYLDRSDQKNDKRFRDVVVGVPFRYKFLKLYAIWLAPVYVWNESIYFKDETYARSMSSAGVSIGLDMLIAQHIYLNINIRYADYAIPNIVAAYRF
jgi:hypothetical protein